MLDYINRTVAASIPCLVYASIWTFLTWAVFPRLWAFTPLKKVYAKQNVEAKTDLNARVTAATHATVVFLLSMYVMCFDDDFTWRNVYSTTSLAVTCLRISGGYFLSDIIVCVQLKQYYGSTATQYIAHHIISVFGIVLSLRDEGAMWFVCCRLLTELSTPFVNFKFMLELLGQAKSALYTLNEHVAFWAFIASRPLLSPFFWYATFSHWNSSAFWSMDPLLLSFWLISAGGLDLLNTIWLKSIVPGYYNNHMKPLVKCIKNPTSRHRG